MRRGLGIVGLAGAGALVALLLWRPGADRVPGARAPVLPRAPEPVVDVGAPPLAGEPTSPGSGGTRRLPGSLRGTDVDGALAVDAAGRFVPSPDAIALFDYFFSALGEESESTIVRRIRREIRARLPADAVPDALALLDAYLSYRHRVQALAASPDAGDLDARLESLHALRVELFGAATAEALFGEDEARARAALARRRILADDTLDDAERLQQLAAVEETLPETVREARAQAEAPLLLWQDEARLRADGGDAAAIRALREARVGPEAAARLAALDEQRAAWRARVSEYRAARAAIESDPALTPDERIAASEALLAERFPEPERRRVEALDRIEAAGADADVERASGVDPR